MDRREIQIEAHKRIFEIEEKYADRDLPKGILSYYLLLRLIFIGDLEQLISEYGENCISAEEAAEGKFKLGWGPLSSSEEELFSEVDYAFDEFEFSNVRLPSGESAARNWN